MILLPDLMALELGDTLSGLITSAESLRLALLSTAPAGFLLRTPIEYVYEQNERNTTTVVLCVIQIIRYHVLDKQLKNRRCSLKNGLKLPEEPV